MVQALLCSDERAHAPQPESQLLTRLTEVFRWGSINFDPFARPYFGDEAKLDDFFSRVCREFLAEARKSLSRGGLLVLKHPALFKFLSEFRELLPEVQIVITVRDPRDQIASELEVAKRADRKHQRTAFEYAKALQSWFENEPDLSGTTVVRYEDLVSDFDDTKRRLESRLNLKLTFDPAKSWPDLSDIDQMRHFPAWGPKYGQPVDQSGAGRHRRDLSADQISEIEAVCHPIMQAFEYERADPGR